MNDDVNSGSSAAAPEDAARPKKPRAKKTAGGPEPKKSASRGGAQAARTKSRQPIAKTRKAEPAAKQHAEKLHSQKGTGFSPYISGAESTGALAPEERSSPHSPDVVPVSAASKAAPKKAAPKKKSPAKRKSKATEKAAEAASAPQIAGSPIEDPIGDVSDGEAWTYTGEGPETDAQSEAEAYRAGVAVDAVDGTPEAPEAALQAGVGEEREAEPVKTAEESAKRRERTGRANLRPPAKLERLQKILSQAGVASRRHAEEMIVAGRVEVNGQVVTVLGSKADPEHDHIRVDGKLLHGAERHRYFLLNKPKGYVTTVSDPEGRPTVMDFVRKLGERVYPVGRLDFQSEGLLLMTNDGALANQLTHASSGVEKTYVVKISGQPDEEELERLRKGVMIERGGPSSSGLYGPGGRVRTAPARIRQIRPGENPWYEVVLTEGRNREIRKMFSAIGHYAEKIRRVGYGPLALDVEPGKLRELTIEEVDALRQAAEGKLKPRRFKTEVMLPKEAGRTAEPRPAKRDTWRPSGTRPANTRSARPHEESGPERGRGNEFRDRGNEFRGRGNDSRGGGDNFRRRGEQKFGPRGGTPREFRGEPRERQPRPRGERPARGRPVASPVSEPRRGNVPPQGNVPRRTFGRPGEGQIGKPGFGRRSEGQIHKPEDREFRNRPNEPGARWRSDAPQRPFRPERRTPPGSGGKSRPGESANFAPKARPGNRFLQGAKPEQAGREHFSGDRDRGRDRFSSKPKPGRFRTGPRPGGQRTGGKRRG